MYFLISLLIECLPLLPLTYKLILGAFQDKERTILKVIIYRTDYCYLIPDQRIRPPANLKHSTEPFVRIVLRYKNPHAKSTQLVPQPPYLGCKIFIDRIDIKTHMNRTF